MRHIKFRGMDIDGKWYFGNITIVTSGSTVIEQGIYFPNVAGMPFASKVNPETVGQFTGLKDKNGVDIYESDIVTGVCSENIHYVCQGLQQSNMMGQNLTGVIRYSEYYTQFYFTTDDINYLGLKTGINDMMVIGNEHQHPHLLEK